MERVSAALCALWAVGSAALPAQGIPVDLVIASTTDVHGRLRGRDYYADTAEAGRGLTRAATIVDFVRNRKIVPGALAAQAYGAMRHTGDADAVRLPPSPPQPTSIP